MNVFVVLVEKLKVKSILLKYLPQMRIVFKRFFSACLFFFALMFSGERLTVSPNHPMKKVNFDYDHHSLTTNLTELINKITQDHLPLLN